MILLCIKIFFVRILDVSLGTIRTIITIKGKNFLASAIGFIEILVWFLVVKEAINTTIDSIWIAVSYALGFASGTYIGGFLSNKFIKANLTLQVISNNADLLIENLRSKNYAVTILDIKGRYNNHNKMLLLEINSKRLEEVRNIIKSIDKDAFVIVDEAKYVFNGYLGN
nr:DUF2179 domain-containing protein [Bacilli bacterium]